METEYLKPFVDGIQELLATMLQSSCNVTTIDGASHADVSGVIDLRGATQLQVALLFPRDTASKIVAELLALELPDVDDSILGDGVGELTNIIAGMAKNQLSQFTGPLEISLPSIIVSSDHERSLIQADSVVYLQVATTFGDFSLRVCAIQLH